MSLFTVEQLELIRRLRQTGICPERIIDAFRSLDQLDNELGPLGVGKSINTTSSVQLPLAKPIDKFNSACSPIYRNPNIPVISSPHHLSSESPASSDDRQSVNSTNLQNGHDNSPVLLQHLKRQAPVPVTVTATSIRPPNPALTSPLLLNQLNSLPTPTSMQNFRPMLQQGRDGPEFSSSLNLHTVSVPRASTACTPPGTTNGFVPEPLRVAGARGINRPRPEVEEFIALRDKAELDEFLKQGEEACISDLKHFTGQYQLRQTTVAQMTGVSQPYISKFLNGNYRELSVRVRTNIFSWYLNCRRNPEKMVRFFADPPVRVEAQMCGRAPPPPLPPPQMDHLSIAPCTPILPSMIDANGMPIHQRRERYVFRPMLLRILEHHYTQNPYPDFEKRLEIAADCNRAMAAEKPGTGLVPKEVVSPQVVANWFANRRKELKRKLSDTDESPQISPDQLDNPDNSPRMLIVASPELITVHSPITETTIEDEASPPLSKRPTPPHENENRSPSQEIRPVVQLSAIQTELDAVNSSVLALVNPYGEEQPLNDNIKVEVE